MMKKIFIIAGVILIFAAVSFAAEKAVVKEAAKTAEKKEPTRQEFIDHLKMMIEHDEELLKFIPELKAQKDPSGKASYTYQGMSLEKLDDKTFRGLYQRAQNELARLRTERLNKQLESIRQAQAAANAAQQASRIPRVVTPPPQPPQTPKQPPAPPPQPPRR